MRRYSATYFIGQSLKGLWKNGVMSFASVLVLLSSLIVMGSFSCLVINIDKNMEELGVLNEIVVFIHEERTEDEITTMYQTVVNFDGVSKVEYISKAQALEEEKVKLEAAGYPYISESINEENNPYRASFIISYASDASIEDLQYKISNVEGIEKVICRSDIAQTLTSVRNGISFVLVWFMIILFVISMFVIVNTIKLAVYARRHEIEVMRYVGATKSFITIPFIIEGMVIGAAASVIAYFVQKAMYLYIYNMIGTDYSMITVIPFKSISVFLLLGFVGIGIITGVVGSSISLRKYLKA
ncbi:MAG: ABC transporter permease [Clostridiales bacterium]|nr:ABC transporter permease [Clostridiales bacterium]